MNNQTEQTKELSAEEFLKSKKLLVPIDYMLPLSTTFPGNIKIVDLLTEYKEALSLPIEGEKKETEVSRIEVIDEAGRAYVKYFDGTHELSYQDQGRTLKIFINPRK